MSEAAASEAKQQHHTNCDQREYHTLVVTSELTLYFRSAPAQTGLFTNFVTIVIIIAGAQVGLATYNEKGGWVDRHETPLGLLDFVVSTIFTCEVVMKLVACEFEPWVSERAKRASHLTEECETTTTNPLLLS